MKISFYTLGCKLNQAETDELKQNLLGRGFSIVPFSSNEDATVIRACGVTCKASQASRETIRQIKRQNTYVIATGCLENNDLPEIDFVAKDNQEIIEHLIKMVDPNSDCTSGQLDQSDQKTRAFIKIQTGCNFQCAYCLIPTFRGKSQSIPAQKVIKKIKQAIESNYKEVVLTGVNICQYEDENIDLAKFLQQVLGQTNIQRIRLGSLDPRLITDKLIKIYLANQDRLLPHWHLSLQSGSNTVLQRMARGYSSEQYLKIVNKLRQNNPLFSFTTDIIVGFPSETEKEFAQSCSFVKQIQFTKVHIFPFSPRPGTPAAKLKPVHNQTVTDRVKKITKICQAVSTKYQQQFIGKTCSVLWENKKNLPAKDLVKANVYYYGYTPEYFRVKCRVGKNLTNQITSIKLMIKNIVL